MKKIATVGVVLFALVVLATGAGADMQSFTTSLTSLYPYGDTYTTEDINFGTPYFPKPIFQSFPALNYQPLTLKQFDPTLGTLTKVTLDLDYTWRSSLNITKSNSSYQSRVGYWLNISAQGVAPGGQTSALFADDVTNYPTLTVIAANSGTDFEVYNQTKNYDYSWAFTEPGDLSGYTGTGNFETKFFDAAYSTVFASNVTRQSITTLYDVTAEVTYEYEPGLPPGVVPLPGALLLLGAGLARLAVYARRRQ